MVTDEDKLVRKTKGPKTRRERDLRRLVNNAIVKFPLTEQCAMSSRSEANSTSESSQESALLINRKACCRNHRGCHDLLLELLDRRCRLLRSQRELVHIRMYLW
jgi:hypothetical protein